MNPSTLPFFPDDILTHIAQYVQTNQILSILFLQSRNQCQRILQSHTRILQTEQDYIVAIQNNDLLSLRLNKSAIHPTRILLIACKLGNEEATLITIEERVPPISIMGSTMHVREVNSLSPIS